MKKVAVGVAVALALVTTNAFADGVDRRYPPSIAAPAPYVAPLSWSGFYVGAGVGAGVLIHDFSIEDFAFGDNRFDGIASDGVFGSVIVGWDWQLGASTVLGVFADYDFHDSSSGHSALDGLIRARIEHDQAWSVGARLGFLSSPSTLWYATAGYTEAEVEGSVSLSDGLVTDTFSRDRTFSGYFVGGGVDTRLAASNWFLRLEYRFSDFGSEHLFRDDLTRIEMDPTLHTARLTLTYKFGSGAYGYGFAPGGWGR